METVNQRLPFITIRRNRFDVKEKLLACLRCPDCSGKFSLGDAVEEKDEIKEGMLRCQKCDVAYAIANYIPRLIDEDNCTHGFGFQWTAEFGGWSRTSVRRGSPVCKLMTERR